MQNQRITNKKFIFKYMPINIFTLKALINNELFFGIPNNFNDPLDCKFSLSLYPLPSFQQAERFYLSLKLSDNELKAKLLSYKENPKIIRKDIEADYTLKLRKSFCITCFSERADSILMWSHYADKHKGICLKFDWKVHPKYFKGYKVQYTSELPKVTYNGNRQFDTTDIFLTKLKHWKYEKEIRSIAAVEDGIQIAAFNPKALVAVIFGEKISAEDKLTIKKVISGNKEYYRVQYLNLNAVIDLNRLKIILIK